METPSARWLAVPAVLGVVAICGGSSCFVRMPGQSFEGALPAMGAADTELAASLRADVDALVGERNTRTPEALERAAVLVEARLAKATGLTPIREEFASDDLPVRNLYVDVPGPAPGLVVVGAHYDSARGTPGADDNASGVAALLALAASPPRSHTVRYVAFVNEEPPFFRSAQMGSRVHAKAAAARGEDVVAMLSLETLGYYRDEPGSQHYPEGVGFLFPDRANFVGFVGNTASVGVVRRSVAAFRAGTSFPSQGAALPAFIPGVDWSDHQAFWDEGWPAVMVTDTAPFRNPNYHEATDTEVDTDRLARVVVGLRAVVDALAR